MSFATLQAKVIKRLDESDGGDRGWWVVTRVHLTAWRLLTAASYLYDAGFASPRYPTHSDYATLAEAMGAAQRNQRQGINRHLFLAMDTPLSLIRRVDGRSWDEIVLTKDGVQLATDPDPIAVFEKILRRMIFCKAPWFTGTRARDYGEFELQPYVVALSVMRQCGGWVDRDEYDLFLSRVRNESEAGWAVDGISEFRLQGDADRSLLLEEVEKRIPGVKRYTNWRDTALHTFSFFSLGQSAMRDQRILMLTGLKVSAAPSTAPAPPVRLGPNGPPSGRPKSRVAPPPASRRRAVLRMPSVGVDDSLETPPVEPAANVGTEGELLIGKLLVAGGWRVVYYSNRRGFGFDIWAHRTGQSVVVEVKSSLGVASSVTLTRLEYEAAQKHGANYILAIVENLQSELPLIHTIADPATVLRFREGHSTEFLVPRGSWAEHAMPLGEDQDAASY